MLGKCNKFVILPSCVREIRVQGYHELDKFIQQQRRDHVDDLSNAGDDRPFVQLFNFLLVIEIIDDLLHLLFVRQCCFELVVELVNRDRKLVDLRKATA